MIQRFLIALVATATAAVPATTKHQHPAPRPASDSAVVRERASFLVLLALQRSAVLDAAAAMPADKYGFAPTNGEFAGVRTFSKQVKHLAATNYILAAAALDMAPPADAGDEV